MFFQKTWKLCRKSEHFFSKAKKMVTVSFTDERMNETLTFPRLWCAMAFALVMFLGAVRGCASASGGEFAFARWNVLASR